MWVSSNPFPPKPLPLPPPDAHQTVTLQGRPTMNVELQDRGGGVALLGGGGSGGTTGPRIATTTLTPTLPGVGSGDEDNNSVTTCTTATTSCTSTTTSTTNSTTAITRDKQSQGLRKGSGLNNKSETHTPKSVHLENRVNNHLNTAAQPGLTDQGNHIVPQDDKTTSSSTHPPTKTKNSNSVASSCTTEVAQRTDNRSVRAQNRPTSLLPKGADPLTRALGPQPTATAPQVSLARSAMDRPPMLRRLLAHPTIEVCISILFLVWYCA